MLSRIGQTFKVGDFVVVCSAYIGRYVGGAVCLVCGGLHHMPAMIGPSRKKTRAKLNKRGQLLNSFRRYVEVEAERCKMDYAGTASWEADIILVHQGR